MRVAGVPTRVVEDSQGEEFNQIETCGKYDI
jgi:hypothetical protein